MSVQPDPSRPVHPLDRSPDPSPAPAPAPPPSGLQRVRLPSSPPVVTYVLLAVNILVFLADTALAAAGYGVSGVGPLTLLGAKNNQAIVNGEYWRLITPLFLHGGLLHLGFNSYFLYIVGRGVERAYGTARFLAIYFLAGLAGTVASFALSRANSIGASGALFGVIGAWIPLLYRNRHVLADTQRQIGRIAQVIGINLLIGLSPGIDNWAHIGGLVGGLALGWFAAPRYGVRDGLIGSEAQVVDESAFASTWVAAVLLAGLLIGLTLALVTLRGGSGL